MKTAFLSLCFLPLTVSAVRLRLEPDSGQFFSSKPFKLICEGQRDGWTVKRTRTGPGVETCGFDLDFGNMEGSTCLMFSSEPSDSGTYWCQDGSGLKTQQVHVTVSGGDLILESPVLPVETGSDVTLRCRARGSGLEPVIFRNSSLFRSRPDWTFSNVSRSDEGLYSCSDLKSGLRSEESWLRVRDPPTPPPTTSSSLSPSDSTVLDSVLNPVQVSILVSVLAALGSLALLVLVLVLVLLKRRQQTGSGRPDAEAEVTYADVTVRRAAEPRAPRPEDNTVYSGVKTHTKGPGSEVTYGEVLLKPKKKKKKRTKPNEPWADPDVVYSSVRVRTSAGT